MSNVPGRWSGEVVNALKLDGFELVDSDGVDDYQGWAVLLFTCDLREWAVVDYSYGSCSGCDQYEEMSDDERTSAFRELAVRYDTEQSAREAFKEAADRGW